MEKTAVLAQYAGELFADEIVGAQGDSILMKIIWADKTRHLFWFVILCLSAIFIALRLHSIGHLLVWDEAMQLNTVRSFCSSADDYFSLWFWRHPPLYSLLMALMRPEASDFAERVERFQMALALSNMLLLSAVTRRTHGYINAVWSAICLTFMPGTIFFDLWIKGDPMVALFGMLSVMIVRARPLASGLCLALGYLSKETAIFYVPACILLSISPSDNFRDKAKKFFILVLPLVISALFSSLIFLWQQDPATFILPILYHAKFAVAHKSTWREPWYFYLVQLRLLLGLPSMCLVLAGVVASSVRLARAAKAGRAIPFESWPLLVAAPSYMLLSIIPSKVPWIVISLLPPIAALAGIGAATMIKLISKGFSAATRPKEIPPLALHTAGFLVLIAVLLPNAVGATDHESFLLRLAPHHMFGAWFSKRNALAVNRLIKEGDRMLLTSFHYWSNLSPAAPCAVFVYYLDKKPLVLLRDHNTSFERLAHDVRKFRLQWALLSPEPGKKEAEIFGGFAEKLGCPFYRLHMAVLFDTRDVVTDSDNLSADDHISEPFE